MSNTEVQDSSSLMTQSDIKSTINQGNVFVCYIPYAKHDARQCNHLMMQFSAIMVVASTFFDCGWRIV